MDDQKNKNQQSPSNRQQQLPIKKTNPVFIQVKDLSPASVGFNLHAKVGGIKPIMSRLNLDKSRLRISEALVGDETGCVLLSLRNDQIEKVKEGDVVILRNAKIDMVNNGFMRIAIDRWGLIQIVPTEQGVDSINESNNLSAVEYELVKEDDNRGGGGHNNRGRGRGRNRNKNNRSPRNYGRGGGYQGRREGNDNQRSQAF